MLKADSPTLALQPWSSEVSGAEDQPSRRTQHSAGADSRLPPGTGAAADSHSFLGSVTFQLFFLRREHSFNQHHLNNLK